MEKRKILDIIGKNIISNEGKSYIDENVISNLSLNVEESCFVIDTLVKNDIDIIKQNQYINELLTDKVLLYQKNKDNNLRDEILVLCMKSIYRQIFCYSKYYNIKAEELFSYVCEGAIYAIENYDISYDKSFVNYLSLNIKFKLQNAMRDDFSKKFTDYYYDNFDNEENVSDSVSDITERKMIIDEYVDTVFYNLNSDELGILMLRYGLFDGKCYTFEEIGKMKGITRQRIYQKEDKILKKIRTLPEFEEKNY